MGIFSKEELEKFAIWTDKAKFEYAVYFDGATKIIESARNDNISKEEIIKRFDELLSDHNERSEIGSRKFFEENIRDIIHRLRISKQY